MIIVTDTLLDIADYLPQDKTILISKRLVYARENIVVEDIGFKDKLPSIIVSEGFNSSTYTYYCMLAQTNRVIEKIRMHREVLIVVDGTNSFDLGVLMALLEKLSNTEFLDKIIVVITYGKKELEESSLRLSIHLYSTLKILAIASSLAYLHGKQVAYTLVHRSYNPRETAFIVKLLYMLRDKIDFSGFFILGYTVYTLPIEKIKYMLKLLDIDLLIDKYVSNVRQLLVLANELLDRGYNVDILWERAREDKKQLWPIRYDLERVLKKRQEIIKRLKDIYSEITGYTGYWRVYPSRDIINYIASMILRMERVENIVRDRELIDKIISEINMVSNRIPVLAYIDKPVYHSFRNKVVVTTKTLEHIVRDRDSVELEASDILVVDRKGTWFIIVGLDHVPLYEKLLLDNISALFNRLEKAYRENMEVLVLVDEVFPKHITLYKKKIPSNTLHSTTLIDIHGIYHMLLDTIKQVLTSGCKSEYLEKIRLYRENLETYSTLSYLPPQYYTVLLKHMEKLEKLAGVEECRERLREILEILSP